MENPVTKSQNIMHTKSKMTIILAAISSITLIALIVKNAPNNKSYIEYEKMMIESGQMKIENSIHWQIKADKSICLKTKK